MWPLQCVTPPVHKHWHHDIYGTAVQTESTVFQWSVVADWLVLWSICPQVMTEHWADLLSTWLVILQDSEEGRKRLIFKFIHSLSIPAYPVHDNNSHLRAIACICSVEHHHADMERNKKPPNGGFINHELNIDHTARVSPFVKVINTRWSRTPSVFISPVTEMEGGEWMDWIDWHALHSRLWRVRAAFSPTHGEILKNPICSRRHPAFSLQETQWLPYLVQRRQHKHCDELRDTERVCVCAWCGN